MNNSIILLNTITLLNSTMTPSFKESYSINIPTTINLNQSGSFEISVNSSLNSNEKIIITTDDSFTLNDTHGKPSISGNITNNEICFTASDANGKNINYTIDNSSCGDWQGNLNLNIVVETISEPAQLIDGPTIQKKLNRFRPTKITFSHDTNINGTYTCDVSKDSDGSILLYRNGSEIIITNMKNEKINANPNMSYFFKSLSNLTAIENIDYIDMSTCTDMSYMFFSCYNLESIDLSSFDTSNVTNMAYTFDSMSSCTSLGDISNWNVTKVTSFQSLFNGDANLNYYGDLSKWNVSNKCTNLASMFAYNNNIPSSLDLSTWDTSNVTSLSNMFINAYNLESLDISNWDLSSVTSMDYMFYMENNGTNAKLNNISGIDNLNIANASKTDLFTNCNNLSLPAWYQ